MKIVTGTLKNGFEYEVDLDKMDSMRFLDLIAEAKEDATAFSRLVKMTFGTEQREALYRHIEAAGEVPTARMLDDILTEIIEQNQELKN